MIQAYSAYSQEPRMVEWRIASSRVPYPEAVAWMEARAGAIRDASAEECVWLLEHPPLYTAGTGAKEADLLDAARFPVYPSGRGGKFTYHGPGQRVAYVMLDLIRRSPGSVPDLRAHVRRLEHWMIAALARCGVQGERREDRIGVWVRTPGGERKIAAVGVRVRRGVSYHGAAFNICPDLSHFSGIVPCGIHGYGVTSLQALGVTASPAEVDGALRETFPGVFGDAISQGRC